MNVHNFVFPNPPHSARRVTLNSCSPPFPVLYPARKLPLIPTHTKQLSFLNIITVVVLDSCHFSIHRGSTYWSPGYGIMLMAVARVSIIAFMADLWIVGYSIAFVVYGGALVREAS